MFCTNDQWIIQMTSYKSESSVKFWKSWTQIKGNLNSSKRIVCCNDSFHFTDWVIYSESAYTCTHTVKATRQCFRGIVRVCIQKAVRITLFRPSIILRAAVRIFEFYYLKSVLLSKDSGYLIFEHPFLIPFAYPWEVYCTGSASLPVCRKALPHYHHYCHSAGVKYWSDTPIEGFLEDSLTVKATGVAQVN